MQVEDHGSLPPRRGLALEIEALRRLQQAARRDAPGADTHSQASGAGDTIAPADDGERLLIWESVQPAVILPRHGEPEAWAHLPACAARGIPLLHRESGGGAVVVGPGCLNVALVLSVDTRPWLPDIECSYKWLLGRLAGVLALDGIATRSTDLAIRERKFAGHAQRRVRGALLHHGVALYDFDLELIDALLPEPPRRPGWRGDRSHRDFLANVPLARAEIVERLRRLPDVLGR
jgi:lipoate-protein ligase A